MYCFDSPMRAQENQRIADRSFLITQYDFFLIFLEQIYLAKADEIKMNSNWNVIGQVDSESECKSSSTSVFISLSRGQCRGISIDHIYEQRHSLNTLPGRWSAEFRYLLRRHPGQNIDKYNETQKHLAPICRGIIGNQRKTPRQTQDSNQGPLDHQPTILSLSQMTRRMKPQRDNLISIMLH